MLPKQTWTNSWNPCCMHSSIRTEKVVSPFPLLWEESSFTQAISTALHIKPDLFLFIKTAHFPTFQLAVFASLSEKYTFLRHNFPLHQVLDTNMTFPPRLDCLAFTCPAHAETLLPPKFSRSNLKDFQRNPLKTRWWILVSTAETLCSH